MCMQLSLLNILCSLYGANSFSKEYNSPLLWVHTYSLSLHLKVTFRLYVSDLEMLSGEQAEKLVSRLSELSTLMVSEAGLLSGYEKESKYTLGSDIILLQKSLLLGRSSLMCAWLLLADR